MKLSFIYACFKCPLWIIKIKLRAYNSITNIPKNTNIQKLIRNVIYKVFAQKLAWY